MSSRFWVYRVRWSNPYTYCEGNGLDYELAAEAVEPGQPCPAELEALAASHAGYTVCISFYNGERKKWTPEAKGRKRVANMKRRIEKAAPLFADELIERELTTRADYFSGN